MLDKEKACTACSGSGYYCGSACGACNGTGLEYSKDDIIEYLEAELKQLQNTSSNSEYAVTPTASPKLLNKMDKFAKECDDAGNNRDAKEVRSWVKQLRIIAGRYIQCWQNWNKEDKLKNIRTRVVHSQTKTAWNVVGVTVGEKYKIARCEYYVVDDDQDDITTVRNKHEALEHAQFISRAFNQACQN